MSTQVPPSISPLPTTPAGEWADSTKTALGEQDHINPPPLQHTLSTPGPQLPGAYPRTAEDVKPIDTSAFNSHNVLNTAKQYLPQAVTSYFDGGKAQTEPQNEIATPQNETATPQNETTTPQNEIEPTNIIPPVEPTNEVGTPQNDTSIPNTPPEKQGSVTTEPESVANLSTRAVVGSSAGLDPVSPSASAVVSEFSAQPPSDSASTVGTNSVLVESPKPTSVSSTDGVKMKNASTVADQGHGPPNTTPPAALANSFLPLNNGSKFMESTPAAHSVPSTTSGGSGGSESTSSSPTKSRFIDKIRGEAKVISGKLSKNEEKIEQGRKLLGKA